MGAREFINRRKDSYDKPTGFSETFVVPVIKAQLNDFFHNYSKKFKGSKVLDVGCGEQPLRKYIEEHGAKYYGLDVINNSLGNVDYIIPIDSSLSDDIKNEAPFDFIILTEVLEHVLDWNATFKNICSLTKSGSIILITCPHFYRLHEEPYDFWRATTHTIQQYALNYDLVVQRQIKAGDGWDVLGTLLADFTLTKKKGRIAYLIYFFAKLFKSILFKILARRIIQKHIGVNTPYYTSNVFVLER